MKNTTCIICYEEKVLIGLENCNHKFCKNCLFLWKEKNGKCPLCRKNMNNLTFILTRNNVKVFQKLIFKIIYDFFEEEDRFSVPEIINLYEKMHSYSYLLYQNKNIRDDIVCNNKRIMKELQQNRIMYTHPKRRKLQELINISNELCQYYS